MPLPSGTVTFLFTDIEGSTRLWEEYPEAMHGALARHDQLLRDAIMGSSGHVIKTVGDAFCAAFTTASDALEAAVIAQQQLDLEDWGEIGRIPVRMAVHAGGAEQREDDYFGPTLSRVARLLAIAHGGQVLISGTAESLLRTHLPADVTLLDMGPHRLKDLQNPEHIYQACHPDLAAEFPPLLSLDARQHNLPIQLTSFIGREKEIAEIRELFGRTRLLTLTGSGGTGKSRLSLQVAAERLDAEPDGVWFIELAPLSDPALLVQAVASVLGVREQSGKPLTQTLTEALKPKKLLLILDNCEHVLDAAAGLTSGLLMACSDVKILASSREGLGIPGEQTYRIPSLGLPPALGTAPTPDAASLLQYEAVRLFADRAALARPDFHVTNENAPAVASLCWRLDGIPLALELAAARVRALQVEQIEARLHDRFRLLTGGSRTALPRQQTLRALIDWSYDLLTGPERALLCRLSVFSGGWTLQAAELVCAGEEIENEDVLDLLAALVDKSLVGYDRQPEQDRYRLLETVRQYARERLMETGTSDRYRLRHLDCYLDLAQTGKANILGPDQKVWLTRLEAEHDNLRAALDFCEDTPENADTGLQLASSLQEFWSIRGHFTEGRGRMLTLLARPEAQAHTKARAGALNGVGGFALFQGDYATARLLYEQSLEVYREIGARQGMANTLNNLGNACLMLSDPVAKDHYEEALAIYRDTGDSAGVAHASCNLGNMAHMQSRYDDAQQLYMDCLEMWRKLGNLQGMATVLNNLGSVAEMRGDSETAQPLFEECLAISRELGHKSTIASTLGNLSQIASSRGDYAVSAAYLAECLALCRDTGAKYEAINGLAACASLAQRSGEPVIAARLHGAAVSLREAIGSPQSPTEEENTNNTLSELRAQIGDAAYAPAFAAGMAMDFERAVADALQYVTASNKV